MFALVQSVVAAFALTVPAHANVATNFPVPVSPFSLVNTSAVVRVDASDCKGHARRGSGFAWNASGTIVTSLHVVAGCTSIGIRYPVAGGRYLAARILRVLRSADLAMLSVNDAPAVGSLTIATTEPAGGASLTSWGYPFPVRGLIDTHFTRREITGDLESLLNDSLVRQVAALGMPSVKLPVHFLDGGHLMPGHSGAPIFNAAGEVAAIADGGLERGAVEINWAIPVIQLRKLQTSTEPLSVGSPSIDALFAADIASPADLASFNVDASKLELSHPQPIVASRNATSCGRAAFTKVRTRTLAELRLAADDIRGLNQLMMASGNFVSLNDTFDVYQDIVSGATVVVPGGAVLVAGEAGCTASGANGRVVQFLRVAEAKSTAAAQSQAIDFERRVLTAIGGGFAVPDPEWTQTQPTYRFDGAVVRRGATIVTQNATMKYVFESLSAKGDAFFGVATVRQNYSPQRLYQQQQCFMGMQSPVCADIRDDLRWQVLMTIATHLSSFPMN
jgi:hypothetical protein